MVRVGGTMVYEDARLYDALDAAGVLLWQDLMFANMDYPDDAAFAHGVASEIDQQMAALQGRPSLAVVCGNSEGEQQAAMFGADRKRWAQPLFSLDGPLAAIAEKRVPGVPYVPSSATTGAFPHAANAGPSSYYGVGAYLRDLDDARRSEVCFATECLAFANIPAGAMPKVHQAQWKQRAPRDLGAGWDFDDVRDHYVKTLYGVDPAALRYADHERYLALGRAASGEVMARTFGEWRRARSRCGGGLVWFWKDLWPGAGWGLLDAAGDPKPCWFAVARACAPRAIAISDEGVNGLALHVMNDRPEPFDARVELAVYRSGEFPVAKGELELAVAPHDAVEIAAASLFDHFVDLSWAYRFGPPVGNVVHASVSAHGGVVSDAFWFPAGYPAREHDVGLTASATPIEGGSFEVTIASRRFAQSVTIDAGGYRASDEGFHLAPGQTRTVHLTGSGPLRGHVSALNAEATARIEA
jgi:beta-mannosidase